MHGGLVGWCGATAAPLVQRRLIRRRLGRGLLAKERSPWARGTARRAASLHGAATLRPILCSRLLMFVVYLYTSDSCAADGGGLYCSGRWWW